MPKTPRLSIPLTTEERHLLEVLHIDLRSPGRRGSSVALSQKVTLAQWVARMAMERAAQVRVEAGAAAAPKRKK